MRTGNSSKMSTPRKNLTNLSPRIFSLSRNLSSSLSPRNLLPHSPYFNYRPDIYHPEIYPHNCSVYRPEIYRPELFSLSPRNLLPAQNCSVYRPEIYRPEICRPELFSLSPRINVSPRNCRSILKQIVFHIGTHAYTEKEWQYS